MLLHLYFINSQKFLKKKIKKPIYLNMWDMFMRMCVIIVLLKNIVFIVKKE